MYRILTLNCIFCLTVLCNAQKPFTLQFSTNDFRSVEKKVPEIFKDSVSVIHFLRDLQLKAIEKGYVMCSIDSIRYHERLFKVDLQLGDRFEGVYLRLQENDLRFLNNNELREKQLAKRPYQPKEVSKLLKSIMESGTNNGYPFMKVVLDSVEIEQQFAYGKIVIHSGPIYKWKEIHVKGDSSLSVSTVAALIRIKVGELYNEEELKMISNRIKQTGYLQEIKSSEVLFTPSGAELFLFLQSNPISLVNGVVGLQPNPVTERISVTGDLQLKLVNILKRGEQMLLNWRSVQPGVQALNMNVNYPFIFKTPFGTDIGFQLYKRDSSFLETKTRLGFQYLHRTGTLIRSFYHNMNSSLLSQGQASTLTNIQNNSYGIGITRREIDYLPNPSKGYLFNLEAAAGSRRSGNSDTTQIRTTTFRGLIQFQYYIPLARRHVIKTSIIAEGYLAESIFRNELYRFGGLSTLRGFNEEEFFASSYGILTLEYRFLVDKNSHAFLFFDQGMYENKSANYSFDLPFGFGTGFSFGTNLGIFSISYALGKQQNNPILLSNGKIHFGYIAYF